MKSIIKHTLLVFSILVLNLFAKGGVAHASNNVQLETDQHWVAAKELIMLALTQLDTPYRYGGNSPATGFDCSGFIKYVYEHTIQTQLPRSTRDMAKLGTGVKTNDLSVGDLVFFNTRGRANSHVGIYIGEQRFIHAPSSGGQVRIEDMSANYWAKRFNGARRLELGNS